MAHRGLIIFDNDEAGLFRGLMTTTEENLTRDLSEDLMDAWLRLREAACAFGEQRIYASHKSIMFSRKSCYFFVRPKKKVLEICFFLKRTLKAPRVRKQQPVSKVKVSHLIHIVHRDEIEAPITDWLQEAYELAGMAKPKAITKKRPGKKVEKKKRR